MTDSSTRRVDGAAPRPAPVPTVNRWHKKRFRIDKGSPRDGARGGLLRTFQAWTAPAAVRPSPVTERRAEKRHGTPECLAWVSWRTFWKFETRSALLIDLSRGGARIFMDGPPPKGRDFWVFLETAGVKVVVRADVREVEQTPQGQCAVRARFRDACPYALFEAAVCGMAASDPKTRAPQAVAAPPPRRSTGDPN